MVVRERLPTLPPDFYHDGNLKLVPTLDKCISLQDSNEFNARRADVFSK
jgi:hypothetical protein